MKRARVSTRSETTRARAHPSVSVSPQALLALFDNADTTAALNLADAAAVDAHTHDMCARKCDATKLACDAGAAVRAALVRATQRAAYCARTRARAHFKRADAAVEQLSVSAKQLRVLGAIGCAAAAAPLSPLPDLGAPAGCALISLCDGACSDMRAVSAVLSRGAMGALQQGCEGEVVSCDGLRVVSAAGPGLQWFDPHSCNKFTVVLAQADGSMPVWLTAGDVALSVRIVVVETVDTTTDATADPARPTPAFGRSACLREGSLSVVTVVYESLAENASEVVLEMKVCGVAAISVAGDRSWCVCVHRRPLSGHHCAAVGTHVRTLGVERGAKYGLAVSADEKWMVVGLQEEGTLFVYALPGGELIRSFGGRGVGPLEFRSLHRFCFAPNGNLLAVDVGNQRLQELTLEGAFVRLLGVGEFGTSRNSDCDSYITGSYSFGDCDTEYRSTTKFLNSDSDSDGYRPANSGSDSDSDGDNHGPTCVDVHEDVVAVGCSDGLGPRVVLFEFGTGAVTSRFGEMGPAPGQLSCWCTGIRFTPDGSRVIVAENSYPLPGDRLSLFTTAGGVFVKCVGVGVLGREDIDVLLSVSGEYVVADSANNRVCVFSPSGSELLRAWGGFRSGRFMRPTAVAAAGRHLYVMDCVRGRVNVFE